MNNLAFLNYLAATDLKDALGKVVGILQGVSMVIMVGCLIIAGVSVAAGRVEYVKHGILGAAFAALSWVLVQALFSIVGYDGGINPQNF